MKDIKQCYMYFNEKMMLKTFYYNHVHQFNENQ